jgi:hypothetical protein
MATYGKYYDAVAAGYVFIGSTAAAGTAFPITTGTAVTFGLWNTSPTKSAILLTLDLGYTSGTIALGSLAISNQYCGFALGTAAPLSAFTDGTPKNALLTSGAGSSMRFTPSAATLTAGGTALKFIGKGIESATAGLGVFDGHYDFDGGIVVPPGNLVFLSSSIAQTGLFSASLMWAEVPN